MMVGHRVSPLPRRMPVATIAAPYMGSANASIRSTRVPRSWTAGSTESSCMRAGASSQRAIPMTDMTVMPASSIRHARDRVSVLRPAPTHWPMMALAAEAIPNPGI